FRQGRGRDGGTGGSRDRIDARETRRDRQAHWRHAGMTSGVKQALPQLAIPKTGVEGKGISGRKGGAGFTEALGKLGDKTHTSGSREAPPTRQDTDLRSGWPRFANRLGASDDQASAALGKP